MGRRIDPLRKEITAHYPSIDTKWMRVNGYFKKYKAGSIQWSWGDKEKLQADLTVEAFNDLGKFKLEYLVWDEAISAYTRIVNHVGLTATKCTYGGLRWWFLCPMKKSGLCRHRRRCGVLYLTPEGKLGCRGCLNLTYRSCQENHKFDRLLAGIAADTGFSSEQVKSNLKRKGYPF